MSTVKFVASGFLVFADERHGGGTSGQIRYATAPFE